MLHLADKKCIVIFNYTFSVINVTYVKNGIKFNPFHTIGVS